MFNVKVCNIGTKVRVTSNFDYDDPMGINVDMERYKGSYAVVTGKGRNENGHYVELDIDRGRFKWTSSMLDPMVLNKGKCDATMLEKSLYYSDIGKYMSAPTDFDFQMEYLANWSHTPGVFERRSD